MAIQKRGDIYRCQISVNGTPTWFPCVDPRTGKPAETAAQARRVQELIRAKVRLDGQKGVAALKPPAACSMSRAMRLYLERVKGSTSEWKAKLFARELLDYFKPDADAEAIDVWAYINWSKVQPLRRWRGGQLTPDKAAELYTDWEARFWYYPGGTRSPVTINGYLNTLRRALNIAHETVDPTTKMSVLAQVPKVPRLKEPVRDPKPIEHRDQQAIIAAAPQYIRDAFVLSCNMAFRSAEVWSLTTDDVCFQPRGVRLAAERTKARRDEFLHANATAWAILKRLYDEAMAGKPARVKGHEKRLIIYTPGQGNLRHGRNIWRRGAPQARGIAKPGQAWRRLIAQLALKGKVRWHDTKAAFTTDVADHASAAVVQALSRHKDPRTTARYLKPRDPAKLAAVEAMDRARRGFKLPPAPPAVGRAAVATPTKTPTTAGRPKLQLVS